MQRLLYIFCLLAVHNLSAQTATGSWYGRADVELAGIHNNYLTEMVLKQKGNRVEGIFGYYFRDKYQSFFVHGRYNPKTREVIIENIPLIYFNSNSTVNSVDCNTNFIAVIINSKAGSTLKGAFYHDERYKYMCPDLKVSYALDKSDKKQDSLLQAGPVDSKIWKPQADDYVVDVAKTDQAAEAAAPVAAKETAPAPQKLKAPAAETVPAKDATAMTAAVAKVPETVQVKDDIVAKETTATATAMPLIKTTQPATDTIATVRRVADSAMTAQKATAADSIKGVAEALPAIKDDSKKIVESFASRKEVLAQVLEVESDSVRLSFYDNGEIDGDSISIFVNKRMVLTHQELAAKALNLYLRLDSTLLDTEISMFAENLGKFPPNTALMVVTDGIHRYEVFMSSSLTENSTIQLRRKKRPVQN
ncbi:MAG TPA: hypothetical protein VNS58_16440 [Puia sp.]|nr:hypothetical protein [Puia sp.]